MIHLLLERLDGVASSAILMREAARTSRRWQTYAARTSFSGALFGVLLLGIWSFMNAGIDPADMGWMGRGIFIAFSTVMMLLAITLAPLMTSAAMIEEIEDRTLEMLILSKLTPARILVGKVLSRILLLLTIVFGALPVLAMVVTLGGVAPHQVIAVILHTLVAVVLMGSLGAFYGLFTKSPMLAMLASITYAGVAFLLFPGAYMVLTAKPEHAAHFSLFAGPATQDWAAVVSLLSYLPSLAVLFVIGTRLFELQISNADIRQSFSSSTWSTPTFLYTSLGTFLSLVAVFPASFLLYTMRLSNTSGGLSTVLIGGCSIFIWAWSTLVMAQISWVMLRVGVDVVDAMDAILGGRDKRARDRSEVKVWRNPVAWREARPAAWGANGMPLLVAWLLLMLGLMQTGWWLVPGGAVSIGVMNTLAALGLTVWLIAKSVEEERRKQSLELLLTTTLSSPRILFGKALGVSAITLPLLFLSLPFFSFGLPYFYIGTLLDSSANTTFIDAFARGSLLWLWTLPMWAVLLCGSLLVALSVKRSRSGFTVALGLLLVLIGLPTVIGRLFEEVWWLATPSRLLVPPLAGGAPLWMFVLSSLAWTLVAIGLFATTSYGLRRWIIAAISFFLFTLATSSPAQAQQLPLQDNFQILVEPLGDGIVRPGRWAPLRVKILNHGKAAQGVVRLEERAGDRTHTFERQVELPEKGRKDVILLYRPSTSHARRELILETPTRRAVQSFKIRPAANNATVGVLGTDPMGMQLLQETDGGGAPGRQPRGITGARKVLVGLVEPGVLPQHSAAWEAFDQLVWLEANPGVMDPTQLDSLLHWVADGGHLVLSAVDTRSAVMDSPLATLLPLQLEKTVDHTDLSSVHRRWGGRATTLPVSVGRERPLVERSVFRMQSTEDGTPLWLTSTYGLGTVTLLCFDPKQLGLDDSKAREGFWRDVLQLPLPGEERPVPESAFDTDRDGQRREVDAPRQALDAHLQAVPAGLVNQGPDSFAISKAGEDFADHHDQRLREWLSDIPGVAPLPMEWLLAFSAVYLFVIGPLDWLVLRSLKRQPLTWLTFPITIVLFSSLALIGTAWVKGSQSVVTALERVDVLPGSGLWRGQNHVGLFLTEHAEVSIRSEVSDSVASPYSKPGYMDAPVMQAGFGPGTASWTAETWTLGYADVRWIEPSPGTVRVVRTPTGLVIENGFDFVLEDVEVIEPGSQPSVWAIGRLDPGERRPFPVTIQSFDSGSSDLARLRKMFYDVPSAGEGYLPVSDYPLVVLALTAPIHPPDLTGLHPRYQRLTLLRIPIPHIGESP